jgi:hypothetical protein
VLPPSSLAGTRAGWPLRDGSSGEENPIHDIARDFKFA